MSIHMRRYVSSRGLSQGIITVGTVTVGTVTTTRPTTTTVARLGGDPVQVVRAEQAVSDFRRLWTGEWVG